MTQQHQGSPRKVNGIWGAGIKGDTEVQIGDLVRIITRAGKQWDAEVTAIVDTDERYEMTLVHTQNILDIPQIQEEPKIQTLTCEDCGKEFTGKNANVITLSKHQNRGTECKDIRTRARARQQFEQQQAEQHKTTATAKPRLASEKQIAFLTKLIRDDESTASTFGYRLDDLGTLTSVEASDAIERFLNP